MKVNSHLPASALLHALLIALLIALLSGSLITLAVYYRTEFEQQKNKSQLQTNTRSGMAILRTIPEAEFSDTLDLFGEKSDSVWIRKESWGMLELGMAEAFHHTANGKKTKRKAAFLGCSPDPISLYLADRQQRLSLAGNTRITGNAFLPSSGWKPAHLEGKPFTGQGPSPHPTSENILPTFRQKKIINTHQHQTPATSFYQLPDSLKVSFFEPALITHDSFVLIHPGHSLTGKILIQADSLIYVSRGSDLQHIWLKAPIILFEEGFAGTIQAFAREKLTVGPNCHLQYPSTIALLNAKPESDLTIESGAQVEGQVVALGTNAENAAVHIREKSQITGLLYSQLPLELKGIVQGNVYANSFFVRTAASRYTNYLLNADIRPLPKNTPFLTAPWRTSTSPKNIITWLD